MIFAIVGGGASSLTAIGQIVNRLVSENSYSKESNKLIIFEKDKDRLATGMPYSTSNSSVWLLNGPPANRFRLLPNGKTLQTWMRENHNRWNKTFPDISPDDLFPPRALVGLYFKDQYDEIKATARKRGIIIEEIIDEVTDINCKDQTNEVITKGGQQITADKVLLCFGHLPSDHFQHLKTQKNYFHSAWEINAEKIPKKSKVHFIGSHLSFIDGAKELVNHNFQGEFVCVTRNPSIVTLRDNEDKCDRTQVKKLEEKLVAHHKEALSVQEFKGMFWNAYQESTKHPIKHTFLEKTYRTKEVLAYQLAKNQKENPDPSVGNFDELRDFMTEFFLGNGYTILWDLLDDKGKDDFIKYFYSFMVSLVAGIPPLNAHFLVEMYEHNRIEERVGLSSITYNEENEEFILHYEDGSQETAKYLVNATGAGRDITKHLDTHPLLRNLVNKGIITASKWGGYTVNQDNIISINPTTNFGEKPGLSAVFLSCHAAQNWIDEILPSTENNLPTPSCF